MKSKGVTTQMKALIECILMVVFMLLLNTVHVFTRFYVQFGQRNMAVKGLLSQTDASGRTKRTKRQARGLVGYFYDGRGGVGGGGGGGGGEEG